MKKITQEQLIKEFYSKNPNRDIEHQEAVDWLVKTYKRRTGKVFRDPDRGIRKLHQSGFLIKVAKGIYKYDPKSVVNNKLFDFTAKQKRQILKRDDYKCVMCGASEKEGIELHVDHIKPKDKGGDATLKNGQTLCSTHNFKKKNYNQTETGKKMFMRLLELANKDGDLELSSFCTDILKTFDKHKINGHIEWNKDNS